MRRLVQYDILDTVLSAVDLNSTVLYVHGTSETNREVLMMRYFARGSALSVRRLIQYDILDMVLSAVDLNSAVLYVHGTAETNKEVQPKPVDYEMSETALKVLAAVTSHCVFYSAAKCDG